MKKQESQAVGNHGLVPLLHLRRKLTEEDQRSVLHLVGLDVCFIPNKGVICDFRTHFGFPKNRTANAYFFRMALNLVRGYSFGIEHL
jgi:hypothetical protein